MKKQLILFLLLCQTMAGFAQVDTDKSLSPYFLVKSEQSETEAFPLQSTEAKINIAGIIADVQVRQTYKNEGKNPIEAVYVFPASTRAAVYAMRMQIGNRVIEANIAEKQQARQQYEQAKSEGKRTTLLEQQRPNVFQMNVANIMPGDEISVELNYTELLIPEKGIYEFVYPTVVGPRYTGEAPKESSNFTATPYSKAETPPSYSFDLSVFLNGGMAIQQISSNTHKITTSKSGSNAATVYLDVSEKQGGNRDFILQYSFLGNQIETGMLVYEDGDENFFLCMAQPPKRVETEFIPSREYIFLMDISGSMRGFPLDISKRLMANLVTKLRPNDYFNIMFFAGGSQLWSASSRQASPENLKAAMNFVNTQSGGGGTNILNALRQLLKLPRQSQDLSRSIVVITDGYVSVEPQAFDLIRNNLHQSNLFAFGIGSSVNRHLIEGMAHAGQGTPFVVTQQNEAMAVANRFQEYIQSPLMTQITACFDEFGAYETEPSSIPDVLSERPVILFGKYQGPAKGKVYLEGYSMQVPEKSAWSFSSKTNEPVATTVKLSFPLNEAKADERNKALKYLWARERIRNLSDFSGYGVSPDIQNEVTQLGLKYNLLTDYTSFIAIEKEIVNNNPDSLQLVRQPLPLPKGVADSAVGFALNIKGITRLQAGTSKLSMIWWAAISLTILAIIILFIYRKKLAHFKSLFLLFISLVVFSSCEKEVIVSENPYQEVTFIMGEDQTLYNPYYATALSYFSTDSVESTPLIVAACSTMVGVRNWLETNAPVSGPWKRINIVAHGNEWTGINVPLSPDGQRCSSSGLQQAIADGIIRPLPNTIIDHSTHLAIFGCNVGKDTLLLQTLGQAFGGNDEQRPIVSSARHFNIFKQEGHSFSRQLATSYFVPFPANSFPGNYQLAQQISTKYPDVAIDWKKALLRLKPQEDDSPYVHYFSIPAEWAVMYAKNQKLPQLKSEKEKIEWVKQQKELMVQLEQMQLAPEAFRWEMSSTKFDGYPTVVAKGLTTIYCVLEPLVDSSDQALYTFVQ